MDTREWVLIEKGRPEHGRRVVLLCTDVNDNISHAIGWWDLTHWRITANNGDKLKLVNAWMSLPDAVPCGKGDPLLEIF
jgi:hypothetical protein